jgi:membrane associated rhomboid family serine protease
VASLPPIPPPGDWVSIFRSSYRRPCEEQALVLKAMGIEHVVTERLDGCHLLVPAASAAQAMEQLGLYRRENPARRGPPWPTLAPTRGIAGAAGFVLVIAVAYVLQVRYAFNVDWLSAGRLVAGAVRDGEWWRAWTALMLHADAAHVAGNMVFGAFFGYLAGQYLGSGVAWLAIVWTAGAGNIANALIQNPAHRSIGASTAVFAALGLVASFVWALSRRHTLGWARRWSPVVGAVALLAYTGTGDEQTDIVAHLTGFLGGVAGGLLVYRVPGPVLESRRVQVIAAALAVLTMLAVWTAALGWPE